MSSPSAAPRSPLVLAITGASGAAYATRLLEILLAAGEEVHLTISPSGQAVLRQELELQVELETERFHIEQLRLGWNPWREAAAAEEKAKTANLPGNLIYHHYQDFFTPIASGSFLTRGMVVCPCSGSTLAGIVHGASQNLIQRAADVHLKERRTLILVPRETPLSLVYLENLRRAADVGAVVLPAMPGWYHGVRSIDDLIDFVVARILDQLGVEHQLMQRWGM